MPAKLNYAVAENVAAIAMEIARSPKFEKIYSVFQRTDGFPLFYQLAIEAGVALEDVAKKKRIEWGNDADWILTVEAYSGAIASFVVGQRMRPAAHEYRKLAESSLTP